MIFLTTRLCRILSSRLAFAVTALWLGTVGCSDTDRLSTPTAQRLKGLSTAYLDYAVAKGSGPADFQSLLRHARNMEPFVLGLGVQGLAKVEDLFVSHRDGQPFIIHFGRPLSLSQEQAHAIAYEASYVEGSRYVAYANGRIDCLEEGSAKSSVLGSAKGF